MVVIGELSVSPASVSILLMRLSCAGHPSSVSAFFTGMTHAHFEPAIQLLMFTTTAIAWGRFWSLLLPIHRVYSTLQIQGIKQTRFRLNKTCLTVRLNVFRVC